MKPFAATLPSDPSALNGFRRSLTRWLRSSLLSTEAQDAIVLAAHEATANGIQHATIGTPVTIEGHTDGSIILVEVTTTGIWGARARDTSEDRGRGLALMKGLFPDLEIDHQHEHITVRLKARIRAEGR